MDMALTQLPWSIPLKSHALLSLTHVKEASLTAVSRHCPTNLTGFAPVYMRGESGSVALKALLQCKLPSAAHCPREPALKPLSSTRKWGGEQHCCLAPPILCHASHWRFGPTNSKGLSKLSNRALKGSFSSLQAWLGHGDEEPAGSLAQACVTSAQNYQPFTALRNLPDSSPGSLSPQRGVPSPPWL